MAYGVRLNFPLNSDPDVLTGNFIEWGKPYLVDSSVLPTGKVNIAISAEVYNLLTNAIVSPAVATISYFEISNDEDFGTYIQVPWNLGNYYTISVAIDGTTSLSTATVIPGALPPTPTEVERREINANNSSEGPIISVRDWRLSGSAGRCYVYIRFAILDVVAGTTTVYPPTNNSRKGYSDSIVWVYDPPTAPGEPIPVNATDNDYVGEHILWTMQQPIDLIAGVGSVIVDLFNNTETWGFIETFDTAASFTLKNSYEADSHAQTSLMLNARADSTPAQIDHFTSSVAGGEYIAETEGASVNPYGFEISVYNDLGNNGASIKTRFNTTFETDAESDLFFVFKNFQDIYAWTAADAVGGSIFYEVYINGLTSYDQLQFDINVIGNSYLGILFFELSISPSIVSTPTFTPQYSEIATRINALNGVSSLKDYIMMSFSTTAGLSFARAAYAAGGHTTPTTFLYKNADGSDVSFPSDGTLEIYYQEGGIYSKPFEIFNLTAGTQIVTQDIIPSQDMSVGYIQLYVKGASACSTQIRAYLVASTREGAPGNNEFQDISGYWFDSTQHDWGTVYWEYTGNISDEQTLITLDPVGGASRNLLQGNHYILMILYPVSTADISTWSETYSSASIYLSGGDTVLGCRRRLYLVSTSSMSPVTILSDDIYEEAIASGNDTLADIAFDLFDASKNKLFSSLSYDKDARLVGYYTNLLGETTKIFSVNIIPLQGDMRTVTLGHRSTNGNTNILELLNLQIDNINVIDDIYINNPQDISIDNILTSSVIFDGQPTFTTTSKWRKGSLVSSYDRTPDRHIHDASTDSISIRSFSGTAMVIDSGIYNGSTTDPGGKSTMGWIGRDIYCIDPSDDDSAYIEMDYIIEDSYDVDDYEAYVIFSTELPIESMVEPSRISPDSIPFDYIRICVCKDFSLKIYRRDLLDDNFESVIKLVHGLMPPQDTIKILLTNEKETRLTKITIYNSKYIVLSEYLDEALLPTSDTGIYIIAGMRSKNNIRVDSAFIVEDIKVYENGSATALFDLSAENFFAHPEVYNLTGTDESQTPDLAFVLDEHDHNVKKYLLASQDGVDYSLSQNIAWMSQVLTQSKSHLKCYGVLIENPCAPNRGSTDNQRLLRTSTTASNNYDVGSPNGDYVLHRSLSNAIVSSGKIEFRTNARAYSEPYWVSSEFQWYEARSPWSSESNWANVPTGTSYKPSEVDDLHTTDHSFTFKYSMVDQAIDGNMEVFLGINNFKPAYRVFTGGNTEYRYATTDTGMVRVTLDSSDLIAYNGIDQGLYSSNLMSTAFSFGEVDNTYNSKMTVRGQLSTSECECYYILPPTSYPASEDDSSSIALTDFKWMQLAICNDGKAYVITEPNERILISEGFVLPVTGYLTVEIKRDSAYNPSVGGINALTGIPASTASQGLPPGAWYPGYTPIMNKFVILVDKTYPNLSYTQFKMQVSDYMYTVGANVTWMWGNPDNNTQISSPLYASVQYYPFASNSSSIKVTIDGKEGYWTPDTTYSSDYMYVFLIDPNDTEGPIASEGTVQVSPISLTFDGTSYQDSIRITNIKYGTQFNWDISVVGNPDWLQESNITPLLGSDLEYGETVVVNIRIDRSKLNKYTSAQITNIRIRAYPSDPDEVYIIVYGVPQSLGTSLYSLGTPVVFSQSQLGNIESYKDDSNWSYKNRIADMGTLPRTFATQTIVADVMRIYQGEYDDPTKNLIAEIYRPTMQKTGLLDYLYFHMGIREKYSTGTTCLAIDSIIFSSDETRLPVPVASDSLTWFLKDDGSYSDTSLVYGRILLYYQFNSSSSLQIDKTYPHLAQSFTLDSVLDRFDGSSNRSYISCITIKVSDSTSQYKWRCTIVSDTGSNAPNISVNNITSTPSNGRPQADLDLTDANILGVAFGEDAIGSETISFVYDPPIEVTANGSTRYWMILTHPGLSIVSTDNLSNGSTWVYPESFTYVDDSTANILDLSVKTSGEEKYLQDDFCLMWNVTTNLWTDWNTDICFCIYEKYYINSRNKIHAQQFSLRASAINKAGLFSEISDLADYVVADIIAPWNPDTNLTPLLSHRYYNYSISRRHDITIKAIDSSTSIVGSGIWRYRIAYKDDYGTSQFSPWITWVDLDSDNIVQYAWYYPGRYFEDKDIYVQVQDMVGNISNSNTLTINMLHGFIIDTEPPYSTRVRIMGDASLELDPLEASYTDNRISDVSVYALDDTTGIKDIRYNVNAEEGDDGQLVFYPWEFYRSNFLVDFGPKDGRKMIMVQFRDYANNADQAIISHILRAEFYVDNMLPTALCSFTYSGTNSLYIACTKIEIRGPLYGVELRLSGRDIRTSYEFQDASGFKQFIRNNEGMRIWVVSALSLLPTYSDYLYNAGASIYEKIEGESNDWVRDSSTNTIIFNSSIDEDSYVVLATKREICVLNVLTDSGYQEVHSFDEEDERLCTCMVEYSGQIFMGFDTGNIYSYNGIDITSQYKLTIGGIDRPVGCLAVHRFEDESRDYIYAGSWGSAGLWRFGNNVAVTEYNWQKINIDTINGGSVKIIGGVPVRFADQTHVFAIEAHEDYLFISTGNNGDVYRYQRYLDITSDEMQESVDVTRLRLLDSDVTQLRCLSSYGDRIFAGSNDSSIWYYKIELLPQPSEDAWDFTTNINETFLTQYYPWQYLESTGTTNPTDGQFISLESHINATTGWVDYYSIILNCSIGQSSVFTQNSSYSDAVSLLNNTRGWALEFEAQIRDYDKKGASDIGQSVQVFDGNYQIECELTSRGVILRSATDEELLLYGDIVTSSVNATIVASYDFDSSLNNWSLQFCNGILRNGYLELTVVSSDAESPPYIEDLDVSLPQDVDKDSYIQIRMSTTGYSSETVRFYLQWSEFSDGTGYTSAKTHSFVAYTGGIETTYTLRPSWSGSIKNIRIIMNPEINAQINIAFIRIYQNLQQVFYSAAYHKYRIAVRDNNISLYIDDNKTASLEKRNWLNRSTSEKVIAWGKTDRKRGQSEFAWKSLRFYAPGVGEGYGDLAPVYEYHYDWQLSASLPGGTIVKELIQDRTSLFALLDPVDYADDQTTIQSLNPRIWKLDTETSILWGNTNGLADSFYPDTCATIIDAFVWNNKLFAATENVDDDTAEALRNNIPTRFDIVSTAVLGATIIDYGNVYQRMYTHAYDDIIQDTSPPVASLIINENEETGGIRVSELVIYYRNS